MASSSFESEILEFIRDFRFVRSNLVAESETCGTKPPKVSLFLPDGLELADDVLGIAELDDIAAFSPGFFYLNFISTSGSHVTKKISRH